MPSWPDDADPLFVDAAQGDFSVEANSPCADAYDGDCPDEPAEDGDAPLCDMGHLGNTADAWPGDAP